jgi:Uma2 family endonuclease
MNVLLPDAALPAKLILNPDLRMSDDDYYEFCLANPNVWFERNAQGEILIVPPVGIESDNRNLNISTQLNNWARRDGRGKAFGPTGEFILPSGAAYAPDAAWVSNARLATLSKAQLKKFVRLVPEFVVEILSPSDRLSAAKKKMAEWMANGVALGWLIDGDRQAIYVYRPGQAEPQKLERRINKISGEGPVEGFVLELEDIWAGL